MLPFYFFKITKPVFLINPNFLMKKVIMLICILGCAGLKAQTVLFSENFESGGAGFTLNTTDVSSQTDATGYNKWIINNVYVGGSGSITCFGFPIGYTIAPTASQPAGIFNFPNSSYMHILSDEAQIDGINCASYLAADGFCNFAQNHFAKMTGDISTVGNNDVTMSFWWLCGGSANGFGEVYYSTDGGTVWNLCTTPVSSYSGQVSVWTQTTIAMAAFGNQPTLRFGFRFVNNQTTAAADPGFCVDDVVITALPSITTGALVSPVCAGDTISIPYTTNQPFNPGNIFGAQLSDNTGSFASPITIGSIAGTTSGTITGVIPPGTATGSGYLIRVVSISPIVVGSSSAITINGLPTVNATNTGPYCTGNSIQLNASPSATTDDWTGPLSYSSTDVQDPTISSSTVAMSGDYTVTITDGNGCSATGSTTVLVNALPAATASNTGPYCAGTTIQLNASPSSITDDWAGPASYSVTDVQNPTITSSTVAMNGIYTVTITDANSCSATATTTVVVNALPAPVASNTGPYCEGATIQLNVSPSSTTDDWTGPSSYSVSDVQNPTIATSTVGMSGTYTVTITDINNCSATATTAVVVSAFPTPTASNTGPYCAGGTIQLNSPAGSATDDWTGPNSYSQNNMQNPTISSSTTLMSGVYTVTVTNVSGCSATATTTVSVVDCSGIEDSYLEQINVYPNPTTDVFTVSIPDAMVNDTKVAIINLVGEQVYSINATQSKTMISSQSLGLKAGIYLIQVMYNSQSKVVRLIVR